jgi:hypothetical protein
VAEDGVDGVVSEGQAQRGVRGFERGADHGWAVDGDFWIRRSALLTLLRGIRAGQPDRLRFTRYAEPMLAEKEFFIRKAIGWVLRELSKRDPAWVTDWTRQHVAEMSGVTFREAVRRLPADDATRLRSLRGLFSGPAAPGSISP